MAAARFTLENAPDVEIPEWALWMHFERVEVTTQEFVEPHFVRVKTTYIPGARRGRNDA